MVKMRFYITMFDIIINEILTYQVECNIQVVTYCDKLWHGLSVVYGLPYLSWSYLGHNFKYRMYSSKFNRYNIFLMFTRRRKEQHCYIIPHLCLFLPIHHALLVFSFKVERDKLSNHHLV